ncbi:MAG: heavy metal-binding domain-containing protein [Candidatus Eremiobacteraeota bacterium]|nr:heavy metal-binding domain-containing protein [Candidatus Eremiobacteraeota bacterium]
MAIVTGLSGNEMYCLASKGLTVGDLVIGNSVFSLGFIGGIASGFKTLLGGEVTQVTSIVREGRQKALERMVAEAERHGGTGISGVTNELIQHIGNVEFLSVGSCLHREGQRDEKLSFSSSADGQELYCQMDAGFRPIKFVFGNVAYSIGIGGGILGSLRSLARGEIIEFSEIFNKTRHLALQRIAGEAREAGANTVVGIKTSIIPFQGMQEMVMIGTASMHEGLPPQYAKSPITSDLTNEEMWNIIRIGYMPIQLVLGVSVYSLGFVGSITSAFKALMRGEINELTTLVYDARENAISKIKKDAEACGADDVLGVKVYVYEFGNGIIEFMAIGTAVKRMEGLKTQSDQLPPQAVMKDKDTFINVAEFTLGTNLNRL